MSEEHNMGHLARRDVPLPSEESADVWGSDAIADV
jgi:hypothetical protein